MDIRKNQTQAGGEGQDAKEHPGWSLGFQVADNLAPSCFTTERRKRANASLSAVREEIFSYRFA